MNSWCVRMVGVAVLLVAASGCLDLTLPPAPPPPGPGTLQGTLVYAVPGRVGFRPAGGARVQLVNSTIESTSTAETGRFLLTGLTASSGQVLVTFDADGDHLTDRQKSIDLQTVKAGPGRNIELGEVPLGRNASVTGKALRGDVFAPSGHAGTMVFISGSPFLANTADDGSFTLNDLPEGSATLSFFRANYVLETRELALQGGEESRVSAVSLTRESAGQSAASRVRGSVMLSSAGAAGAARAIIAGNGLLLATVTGSDGLFAFEAVPPGVYQFAIENEATVTLRLVNVVVGSGETDLGVFTLQPGVSTAASLDAGFEPEPEGVGAAARALDDVVAPGGVATLTAAGSSGKAPLRYHWAFDTSGNADAGVLPAFSANDSSSASTTSFTAPATPQRLKVLLTVTDALNRSITSSVANVFVGSRPIARITGLTSTQVSTGTSFTLDGSGSMSPDGSPITHYRWSQIGGEPAQGLLGDSISQTVTAPARPSPVTFSLTVESSIGIASTPVELSLAVTQAGGAMASFTVSPGQVIRVSAADTVSVVLQASVVNAPANANITYRWSVSWPFNATPSTTSRFELYAPKADRTDQVTLSVNVNGIELPVQTKTVTFIDDSTPTCNASLTQLSFRYSCSGRALDPNAVFESDAGIVEPMVYDPASREYIIRFLTPPALNSPVPVSVTKLRLATGAALADLNTTFAVSSGLDAYYRSRSTSLGEPTPGWAWASGNGGGFDQIIGRRVGGVDGGLTRVAWMLQNPYMSMNMSCTGSAPCLLDDADAGMAPISGAGNTASGKTVFNLNDKAYVVLSNSGPGSVVCSDLSPASTTRAFAELPDVQPFFALATDGTALSKISLNAQLTGLERSVLDTTRTWVRKNETFSSVPYSMGNPVSADFRAPFMPSIVSADSAGIVRLVSLSNAKWNDIATTAGPARDVRVVALNDMDRDLVVTRADGTLWLCFTGTSSACTQIYSAPVDGFDAIGWGSTTMVAYAHNSYVYLGVFDRAANALVSINADSFTQALNNGTPPLPASRPQLQLIGNEVRLTWQEREGSVWHMAGRRIR